ncbi:hypothetical protein BOH78_1315 [Pichia kudriavzevii]|uniref:Uncharacterized protein n=1 Tax=Pichia kudriavzevii TaxID=4909 RepID=A0A1V2LS19_PICKU|nr:hypothetical protein BOH78_1315 [Pichia kudriavzevii]
MRGLRWFNNIKVISSIV